MRRLMWMMFLGMSFWTSAVAAVDIVPFTGYRFGGQLEDAAGNKVNIEDSPSYGLIAGFDIDNNRRIEILYSHQATELTYDTGGTRLFDVNMDYLHLGGTYMADKTGSVNPFVSGGIGMTYMDPDVAGGGSETRLSLSVGGGVEWMPASNVGLRLEARAAFTMLESGGSLFCSNGGCELSVSGSGLIQFETVAGLMVRF